MQIWKFKKHGKEIAVGTIQSTLIVIRDHDKTADCI